MNDIAREAARRRTFAIISHPDAGKTTLTEKFLLYGGALHLAGSVSARKNQRAATSDWMELERKREAFVYEIKILTPSGRRREVEINARTLDVIKVD